MAGNLFRQLIEAQRLFQQDLLNRKGVVGVAVGYRNFKGEATDELALAVLVEQKKPVEALSPEDLVPRDLDGVPTDIIEVGRLEAQLTPRDRYRPQIPSGVTIGHYKVTAGTLGVMVFDRTTGEPLILSNNHVLANSNEALIGDPILQPGPTDHGARPDDVIAQLLRFERIYYEGDLAPPPPPSTPTPPKPPTTPTPPPTTPTVPTTPTTPTAPTTPTTPPTTPIPPPTSPTAPTTPTTPTAPTTPTTPTSSGCDIVDLVVNFGNALAKLNGSEKRLQSTGVTQAASAQSSSITTATINATAQADYIHNNLVDAALARPNVPTMFTQEILQIGRITGTKTPTLGMNVRKHGRTTGYTEGTITLVNATVNVSYNTSQGVRQARFTGQIITSPMSQGGDSGSLIVEMGTTTAVGLLFAGSSRATIFTPITRVLDTMNIRF